MNRSPALLIFALGCTGSMEAGAPDAPASDPRQPERDASIFTNLDFETVDGNGVPADWQCFCGNGTAACQTTTADAEHGARSLVLPSGCAAVQTTTVFDATKGVRFDLFGDGAVVYPTNVTMISGGLERAFVDGLAVASPAWQPIHSIGAIRTAGLDALELYLVNTTPEELHLDDLIAVQDVPNPAPKSGSLLVADHLDRMSYTTGTTTDAVYTPLPIDFASQVPLYVELTVAPASVVDHIEYVGEAESNWGAIVHFVPTASSDDVTLAWHGVVMTRTITDAERPTLYAAVTPPAQWLPASPIIDAAYPPIAQNAASLEPTDAAPLDKLLATIGFTSAYITNLGPLTTLDATTVYTTRNGSCTGFANLAAATGRALGVPVRHVSNIMVGLSQDMHSIDEFYLGADLGWRRVEPQGTQPTVAEDYGLIMRLQLPADEGAAALPTRPWVLGGAPLHEFTEPVATTTRLAPLLPDLFADCAGCGNRADPQVDLREDPALVAQVFAAARARWAVDRAKYLAGGLDAATMTARRGFLMARTLADVQAVLASLP